MRCCRAQTGDTDKDEFAGKLFRGWLGGFIQIAKYALGDAADPFVLYQMARDEARLQELLQMVARPLGDSGPRAPLLRGERPLR